MSKRDRSTNGAFDTVVHAIAGLGTAASRVGLAPATAPGSLARALAQGVVQGRLPRTAKGAGDDPPQPVEEIHKEGQRSVTELGAILWHAMDGQRDAPELAPWMIPPHADPIVALSLSRRRLDEYAAREAVDRTCSFPGPRVWLIEIERAKGDTPAGIAVWRSRGANGEWRTRCACVWTHGPIGSTTHPLVIGAQWAIEGNGASAGACVLGASWDHATRAAHRRIAKRGAGTAAERDRQADDGAHRRAGGTRMARRPRGQRPAGRARRRRRGACSRRARAVPRRVADRGAGAGVSTNPSAGVAHR